MNDDRTGKRRPAEQREPNSTIEARDTGRDDQEVLERRPKASPIERREWRGSGVCGDRHTD
ncbi:MAG TPA: hypothetical protein VE397_11355 [Stellaceae bacterium]|jgi:hypothetical protein|nr:hypothetical protein [Stellaceae bacterium]